MTHSMRTLNEIQRGLLTKNILFVFAAINERKYATCTLVKGPRPSAGLTFSHTQYQWELNNEHKMNIWRFAPPKVSFQLKVTSNTPCCARTRFRWISLELRNQTTTQRKSTFMTQPMVPSEAPLQRFLRCKGQACLAHCHLKLAMLTFSKRKSLVLS